MLYNFQKKWTTFENKRLVLYHDQKKSTEEIAELLGRTFESTRRQIGRLIKQGMLKKHCETHRVNNHLKWQGIVKDEHEAWLNMVNATGQEKEMATLKWLELQFIESKQLNNLS